ncbi:MAG: peptidoglycan-binding protein, partial [Patescibacteria group bacterium]|nr:peptidoglycan-binding protein [Patescibacteria group bacterium]
MSNVTTKAIAKVAAVATGLGMATSLLSLAPMAHAAALTSSQINSIVSLLQSFGADATTIANVQASLSGGTPVSTGTTGSMSGSCSFTMDLHTGSSGAQVTCLQNALIAAGYSIPAGATGYFGAQTKTAVMAWQAKAGVTPAAGYFGSISRAAWNLGGSSSTGTGTGTGTGSSTSTTLTGAGYLTNESHLGSVTSDLHAGDSATAVVGSSFDATGGDVQLQRVDATFDLSGVTTGSTNLDQYVSDVELWDGNTKLASMSASAGDESSNIWTYRFTGINDIVKNGQTANLYIKVTPLTSVGANQDGSANFEGTMKAQLLADAIRAVGADGISDTYGTLNSENFTVSSANTGTLTASPAADNPVASQVAVASSTTTGVKLLAINLKAKNSDITVKNLQISLNTSATNLSDVVNTVYLMKGSTVLKSATLGSGKYGTVTFSNMNETIPQDQTNEYTITADIKGDSAYADGTTLIASSTTAGWDIQDAQGNSVTPSAAVTGNTLTLTASGLSVSMGTPTATLNSASFAGGQDTGTFALPFTVTAGDTAIWVGGTATATTTTNSGTAFATSLGVVFATTTTSSATTTTTTASVSAGSSNSNDNGTNYYVAANSSRTFTLNLSVGTSDKMSSSASVELGYQLVGINYSTTNTMGTTYFTSNLNTFKT